MGLSVDNIVTKFPKKTSLQSKANQSMRQSANSSKHCIAMRHHSQQQQLEDNMATLSSS